MAARLAGALKLVMAVRARKKTAKRAMDLSRLDLAEYYGPFVTRDEARQLLALAKS